LTVRIELVPTLEHCIETTARRELARSRDEYLESGGTDAEIEQRIDVLTQFLGTADLRRLRSESEKHLIDGRPVIFILSLEEGRPMHEMRVG
jgi:hypothetical protein